MERGNENREYTRLAGEHLRCRFCRSVMRFPMKTNLLGLKSGLFWLAVALVTGASSGNAAIIVSINGMDNPDLAASWNVPDVGWLYTPPFSYAFTSIGTLPVMITASLYSIAFATAATTKASSFTPSI
jgi:hypothetical protein